MVPAESYDAFAEAIIKKLIIEIAATHINNRSNSAQAIPLAERQFDSSVDV